MSDAQRDHERLEQLLADRATEGLSGADQAELDRLLSDNPAVDPLALELAAAAAALALSEGPAQELPAHLREKVRVDAARIRPTDASMIVAAAAPTLKLAYAGWWAAAAGFAVAAVGWWWAIAPGTSGSIQSRYDRFVEQTPDLLRAEWAANVEDYAGVTGEVVWSDTRQAGFMVFKGLPANGQTQQYQLWIVDPQRDRNPVDGGVFDIVAQNGKVIVEVDPKLVVSNPQAFAITLEQPGGVVVSDGPLLIVAAPES